MAEGKERALGKSFAIPGAVAVLGFVWIPLLIIGAYSFFESTNGAAVSGKPSLVTWKEVFADDFYFSVLLHTLKTAAICVAICVVVGYPAALAIASTKGWTRGLLLGTLVVPFWISYVVRMMAWTEVLAEFGLLNRILLWAGWIDKPLKLLYTDFAVVLGLTYWLLPFMIINIFVGLESLDRNIERAARTLGASAWSAFWTVTFPLSLPGLAAGSLICTILASSAYITPMLLGGPKSAYFGLLIYESLIMQLNWPLGAALAILFFGVIALAIGIFSRFVGFDKLLRKGTA
ncbi:ABC transporter permease [Ramlibacter sp.]|uniref:ABC transporter permease n=1 Tax=Ramlibacter sp. TaxID=1917967 RepID=UPI003D119146